MEIELRIESITCIKANEALDEVYCLLRGNYHESKGRIENREPKGAVWKLSTGQSVGPKTIIFSGDIDKGVRLVLSLHEEDAGGLIAVADDTLGSIIIEITAYDALQEAKVSWAVGKDTRYLGINDDKYHVFHLLGARAEYNLVLSLFEKRPI